MADDDDDEGLNGFHIKKYPNGDYFGEFLMGMFHGRGKFRFKNGETYVGEWKNNKMEGSGKYTYADESTYEGGYSDGKKHGVGIYTTADGDTFSSQFHYGEVLVNEGTASVYGAGGHEVVVEVPGIEPPVEPIGGSAQDKVVQFQCSQGTYRGEVQGGVPHGSGEFLFDESGDRFEGLFKDGAMHGRGIYTWGDGSAYDGNFELGLLHGNGYYTHSASERGWITKSNLGEVVSLFDEEGKPAPGHVARSFRKPAQLQAGIAMPAAAKNQQLSGVGVGISFRPGAGQDKGPWVSGMSPGMSAEKSGLIGLGDVLVEAGGRRAIGMDLIQLAGLVRGKQGSQVRMVFSKCKLGAMGEERDPPKQYEVYLTRGDLKGKRQLAVPPTEEEADMVASGVEDTDDDDDDEEDDEEDELWKGRMSKNAGRMDYLADFRQHSKQDISAMDPSAVAISRMPSAGSAAADAINRNASGEFFGGNAEVLQRTESAGDKDASIMQVAQKRIEDMFHRTGSLDGKSRAGSDKHGTHGHTSMHQSSFDHSHADGEESFDGSFEMEDGMGRAEDVFRIQNALQVAEEDQQHELDESTDDELRWMPGELVEITIVDRGNFAKMASNPDTRMPLFESFEHQLAIATQGPIHMIKVKSARVQQPLNSRGGIQILEMQSEFRKNKVDIIAGHVTSVVTVAIKGSVKEAGGVDVTQALQLHAHLADTILFKFEHKHKTWFSLPFLKDAGWVERIGREKSQTIEGMKALERFEHHHKSLAEIRPARDLDEEHHRTLREELFKAQEESKAIWSKRFMGKYGNPHMLVMDSKRHQEIQHGQNERITQTMCDTTSYFRVRKKLNQYEHGMRVLVIDRSARSMRNEVPEDEKQPQVDLKLAGVESWQNVRKGEILGSMRKEIPFTMFKRIEVDTQVETHLTIKFHGRQRKFELWFTTERDRRLFVGAIAGMVNKSCFPPPIMQFATAEELSQALAHRKLPAKMEFDIAGHPKKKLTTTFSGYTEHPLSVAQDAGGHPMVPPNARTPGLSNQQSAYVVARSAVSTQYYGNQVLRPIEGIEESVVHEADRQRRSGYGKRGAASTAGSSSVGDGRSEAGATHRSLGGANSFVARTEGRSRLDASVGAARGTYASTEVAEDPGKKVEEFDASDHVIAYKLLNGIERQLNLVETQHAIAAKYADRLLKAKVSDLIGKQHDLRELRQSMYQQVFVDKKLMPTKQGLEAFNRTVCQITEMQRFKKMMQESAGATSREFLAHPVAYPLCDDDQDALLKSAGPEKLKLALRCFQNGESMRDYKASVKHSRSGGSQSGGPSGGSSSRYSGSTASRSEYGDGDLQVQVQRRGGVRSASDGGGSSARGSNGTSSKEAVLGMWIKTKDLRAGGSYRALVQKGAAGLRSRQPGSVMFEVVSSGGLLTGEQVTLRRGLGGQDFGGLSMGKRPMEMWQDDGGRGSLQLLKETAGGQMFSVDMGTAAGGGPGGGSSSLTLKVDPGTRTIVWYDWEGEFKVGEMGWDPGEGAWTLQCSAASPDAEDSLAAKMLLTAIGVASWHANPIDSVMRGKLW